MITTASFNNETLNSTEWNKLFEKSWTVLYDRGKLLPKDIEAFEEDGQIAFTNLAHYFSYLEQLIEIDPLYLMLPIDEAPFTIDANTRSIEVPPAFRKCSGVQSDNYAEIITFVVDRYFDYKDLADTEIAVQWINEAAGTQGLSIIKLIDLETKGDENKIRFGWPLTQEMTAAAGNLRFAVRFFTRSNGTFNYVLNTATESIPIKATLPLDSDLKENDSDLNYFKTFVKNSSKPSYGMPTQVVFQEDLPTKAAIIINEAEGATDNDTLTLKARATSADMSPIKYVWYHEYDEYVEYPINPEDPWPETCPNTVLYKKVDTIHYQEFDKKTQQWPLTKPVKEEDKLYVKIVHTNPIVKNDDDPLYELNDVWFEEYIVTPEQTSRPPAITLWWDKVDPEDPDALPVRVPYKGVWPPAAGTTLYTRYTKLYFKPNGGEQIIGTYYIEGLNQVKETIDHVEVVVNESSETSTRCEILPPDRLESLNSISSIQFFDAGKSFIKLTLKKDANNPTRYYQIVKTVGNEVTTGDLMLVDKKDDEGREYIEYQIPEAGAYSINIISKVNRIQIEAQALGGISEFYNPAITPTADMYVGLMTDKDQTNIAYIKTLSDDFNDMGMYDPDKKIAQFGVDDDGGDMYALKVLRTDDGIDGKDVKNIEYIWTKSVNDGIEEIVLDPPGAGNAGYGDIISLDEIISSDSTSTQKSQGSVLKVRNSTDPKDATRVVTYKCTIKNTISIAGLPDSTQTSDAYTFVIVGNEFITK